MSVLDLEQEVEWKQLKAYQEITAEMVGYHLGKMGVGK